MGHFAEGLTIVLTSFCLAVFYVEHSIYEYQKVIKECEQKLLQENAPRSIVCRITAVAVDENINGEKK